VSFDPPTPATESTLDDVSNTLYRIEAVLVRIAEAVEEIALQGADRDTEPPPPEVVTRDFSAFGEVPK
jgi:hypothetical protein